ncbi:hypothetical protein I302_100354 [Kwoniella bestiolae CBS 10118]|uniref:Uncharacterized protein n=1 Tax=Kwoniella bestiolae CBS 10118 TaxID=1296100 RepID=A0A1B9G4T4_9TREE|nr:hypothetical protein I302_03726 [Kwoniella bestiolae CBS 10118]OCF26049.1 hypothetical protein I302_03726 [Kwoniella bestiolae CBS 10118]
MIWLSGIEKNIAPVSASTASENIPSSSSTPSQPLQPNEQIHDIYTQLQSLREVQSFHYLKIMEDKREIALLKEEVKSCDEEITALKKTVHRLEVGARAKSTSPPSQSDQGDVPRSVETAASDTTFEQIAQEFGRLRILPLPVNSPMNSTSSDESFEVLSPPPEETKDSSTSSDNPPKTEEGNQAQKYQSPSQKPEVQLFPPNATPPHPEEARDPLAQFKQEILTNLLALRIRIDQYEETHQISHSDIQSIKTQLEDMKSALPLTRNDRQGLKWLQGEMHKLRTIQNSDIKNNLFFRDLLEKINERIKGMDPGKMASLLNSLNYLQGRLEVLEDRLGVQERRVEDYGDEKIRVREV